jgi:hypothetical protein
LRREHISYLSICNLLNQILNNYNYKVQKCKSKEKEHVPVSLSVSGSLPDCLLPSLVWPWPAPVAEAPAAAGLLPPAWPVAAAAPPSPSVPAQLLLVLGCSAARPSLRRPRVRSPAASSSTLALTVLRRSTDRGRGRKKGRSYFLMGWQPWAELRLN